MKSIILSVTTAALLGTTLIVTGCGGSGGNSQPQEETGAVPAEATSDNGAQAVRLVIDGPDVEGILDTLFTLMENTDIGSLPQTLYCDNNGTAVVDGDVTLSGGDMSIMFNGCMLDGNTMDGQMNLDIAYNVIKDMPTAAAVTFPASFAITESDGTLFDVETGTHLEMAFTDFNETGFAGTQTGSAQWSYGNEAGRFEDLTIVYNDTGLTQSECYTAGKLYINGLSEWLTIDETYDVNCDHALIIGTSGLTSGSIRLIGLNGNTIDVNVTDTNILTVFGTDGSTATINVAQ